MLEWLNKVNLWEVYWKAIWMDLKPILLNWGFWLIVLFIVGLKWIEHKVIRRKK